MREELYNIYFYLLITKDKMSGMTFMVLKGREFLVPFSCDSPLSQHIFSLLSVVLYGGMEFVPNSTR
jgi:hypothetical protein